LTTMAANQRQLFCHRHTFKGSSRFRLPISCDEQAKEWRDAAPKSVLNFLTKRIWPAFFDLKRKRAEGRTVRSGKMLMNFDGGKKRAKWACHCLMRRTRRTSPVKQSGPVEEVRMPSRHQQPGWWQPERVSHRERGVAEQLQKTGRYNQ
jgi:hypothetical protein